jgi:hypothetical protein
MTNPSWPDFSDEELSSITGLGVGVLLVVDGERVLGGC